MSVEALIEGFISQHLPQHRKKIVAPAALGGSLQTVVLHFSVASAKLELGLDPDFSIQELLAREGPNSNN